jgi:ribosomal protein L7/L12
MLSFLFGQPGLAPHHAARLRRIEAKLDLVLAHLGISYAEEGVSEAVRQAIDRGEKIQAIKIHREETGVGLAEAKRAVEEYMARG